MNHDGTITLLHRRPALVGLVLVRLAGLSPRGLVASCGGLEQAPAALVSGRDLDPDGPVRRRCGAVDGAVLPVEERGHLPGKLLAGAAAGCALC